MAVSSPKIQQFNYKLDDVVVQATKHRVEWTIQNYQLSSLKSGRFIKSSKFLIKTATENECEWYLNIYPKGDNEECKDYSSLYFYSESFKREVNFKCRFSILNIRNEQVHAKESGPILLESKTNSFGYPKFIENKILSENAEELLPGGNLTIVGEVVMYSHANVLRQNKAISVPKSSLSSDFLSLFTSQKLTDVTFKVGEREIGAHKLILSARSPVFSAMFDHDMNEKKNNHVEIVDMEYAVVHEMLEYIYTGTVKKLKDMAKELLQAADKYAMEGLKKICEKALYEGLTIKNAPQTLIFADLHGADQLKKQTIAFINARADIVTKTEEWQPILAYPHLLVELYYALHELPPICPKDV